MLATCIQPESIIHQKLAGGVRYGMSREKEDMLYINTLTDLSVAVSGS